MVRQILPPGLRFGMAAGPGRTREPVSVPLSPQASDTVFFSGKKTDKPTFELVSAYDVDYLGRVNQYRFSNGLEAYIIQDRDAEDLVSYGVAVKTGSVNETEETNGGSHFFEHEIFKGTDKIGPMKAPKILQALGSGVNAYTSNDVTFFYGYEFEKPALPEVIKLWTEMLMNHAFPEKELNRERGVVIEEIKRSQNNKAGQLFQTLTSNVWADHRYRRTILGPIRNIARMPVDKFREYYAKYYAPSNQAAIAIGNFNDQDIAWILDSIAKEYAQTFDALPARKLPPLPPREGEKDVLIREKVRTATVRQGFDGPRPEQPATDKELIALDLLTNVLGAGKSARLHQRLVETDRLANNIGMHISINAQRSMVTISGQCDPDKLEDLKRGIREEIDKVIDEGVTPQELEEARIVTENEMATLNENQRTKLNFVGKLAAQGRLDKSFGNQIKLASEITSEDIQAAVRKYLGAEQGHTVAMVPEDYPVQPYEKTGGKKPKAITFAGSLTPEEKSETLPGGTELLVREKPGSSKKTAISLLIPGGRRADDIPGTMQLLAMMLQRGTSQLSAAELQKRLGTQKLELNFETFYDYTALTIDGLKQFTPDMFGILTDIVQNPAFREEELAFVKNKLASDIKNTLDTSAQGKLADLTTQTTYGNNHPYGNGGSRILENLDRVTLDDIRSAYNRLFTQGNVTVSVVGDAALDAVREPAARLVEKLPQGKADIPAAPVPDLGQDELVAKVDDSLSQAEINRVWYAPDIHDADRPALQALNTILSGGFARLFMTFRESGEKGLCYTAKTDYTPVQNGGTFEFYIGTSPENINKVLGMFQNELDLLINEPVPSQELRDQLTFLKARLKAGEQSPSKVSRTLAKHRAFDNPSTQDLLPDIEKVTAEDIQRVARKYLTRPSRTIVLAPEEGLRSQGLI